MLVRCHARRTGYHGILLWSAPDVVYYRCRAACAGAIRFVLGEGQTCRIHGCTTSSASNVTGMAGDNMRFTCHSSAHLLELQVLCIWILFLKLAVPWDGFNDQTEGMKWRASRCWSEVHQQTRCATGSTFAPGKSHQHNVKLLLVVGCPVRVGL